MSFSSDPNKQEVIFNRKLKNSSRLPLTFNSINVFHSKSQKHLGIALDSKPSKSSVKQYYVKQIEL